MAVRSLVGLSPVTDSMVVTTPVDSSNYTTERLGEVATVRRGQPFIATQPYLSNVTFRKGGETGTFVGTVKVSIQAASGSNPSGIDLASRTYTNTEWLALAQNADITITLRTTVTVGSTYFIVFISSTSDNSNYSRLYFNRNVINQNTAGRPQVYNGSTWSEGSGALYFKITSGPAYYSEVARTTVTTPRTPATNRVATRDMGTALRFGAATSDQVAIENTNNEVWAGNTDVTIEQWVKPTAFGDFYAFSHPDSAGANRTYIVTNTAGQIILNLGSSGPTSTQKMVKGQWYHFVLVKDRTNSLCRFYLNGALIMGPTAYTPGTAAGTDIFIGQQSAAGSKAWNGVINSTRIWERALSTEEVTNLHLYDVVPRNGLIGEYLFNETIGTTALDSSGNGNNGTITGATYTTDAPYRLRNSI